MHLIDDACRSAADQLASSGDVQVVAHIDADGLCSAAVATQALTAADVDHQVRFVKNLGIDEVGQLLDEDPETVWFVDLGSGAADNFPEKDWVITDHHQPKENGPTHHLNPLLFGRSGGEVSGAGMTWAVARHLAEDEDLTGRMAATAVVGAVGDLQHAEKRKLYGLNRGIVQIATEAGHLDPRKDLTLYGRETRILHKFLQYADNPKIPGVSGSAPAAIQFLAEHDVPRRTPEGQDRCWVHLEDDERSRLANAMTRRILAGGLGHTAVHKLFGEVYQLPHEEPGTQLHDAKEFATLLNSTARYDRADVGLALAMGDRGSALEEAHDLMQGHRRALVEGLNHVQDQGLEQLDHLQYFHGGDRIRDTIVGIVAGMATGRRFSVDGKVMVGFARADPGEVKVSARAPRDLVGQGVDLSEAIGDAARAVGGEGGGHEGAAGATLPAGSEPEFLTHLDGALGRQLGTRF